MTNSIVNRVQLSLEPVSGAQEGRYFAVCAASAAPAVTCFMQTTASTYAASGLGRLKPFPATQLHPTGAVVSVHPEAERAAPADAQRTARMLQPGLAAEKRSRAHAQGTTDLASGSAQVRAQPASGDGAGPIGQRRATDASAEAQRTADAALDKSDSDEDVDVPFAVAGNGDMPLYEQRRADTSMRARKDSQAAGDACLHGGGADAGSSPGAADRADERKAPADVRDVELRCVLAGEYAVPDPWSCLASAMLIKFAP